MTQSAAPDGRVVRRVIATDAATALLGQIIERHGPVLIHQSGGCCDGSSPMVYPRGEFRLVRFVQRVATEGEISRRYILRGSPNREAGRRLHQYAEVNRDSGHAGAVREVGVVSHVRVRVVEANGDALHQQS